MEDLYDTIKHEKTKDFEKWVTQKNQGQIQIAK